MSTFSLMFRIDAPAVPGDRASPTLSAASDSLRGRLYPSVGLKVRSAAWVTIAIGSRKADAVIRALAVEREAGRAFVGAATLTEVPDREEASAAPWFLLHTRVVDDFNLWDDYPSCRAGTLPKVHALNHTFVSASFVDVCRRRSLNGVSFLRCATRGRKPGEPWFVALPDRALGRGLDHPWFDRARWLSDVRFRPARRTSSLDIGQWAFHQCWMRDEAAAEPRLHDVLTICPTPRTYSPLGGLTIVTIPRYWRGALPDTDFAYVPSSEDGPNREGKILRFRDLLVSGRARAALLEAGLFEEKVFLPVRVVDEPEPGIQVLDDVDRPLEPMYTRAELERLRQQEAEMRLRALDPG